LRGLHQLLPAAIEQPAVSGMSDGLGLHRRIQYYVVQAAPLDDPGFGSRFDGVREQPFAARLADPLAPAHQTGRVARQFVPEVPLATDVLPVRVLDPSLDHVLVAERVDMLEVQQCGHQSGRQCRPSRGGDELWAPLIAEGLPVDQFGQANQLMTVVDQIDQFGTEQVLVGGFGRLRPHQNPGAVCKESISIEPVSCNLNHRLGPRSASIHAGREGSSGPTT
jgi:hypothetical protein